MSSLDYEKLRSYMKGYEDAKRGVYDDGSDFLLQLLTFGLAGGPSVDSEAYDRGYSDGKNNS